MKRKPENELFLFSVVTQENEITENETFYAGALTMRYSDTNL